MKMISYNVRGLGKKAKRREIRELVTNTTLNFAAYRK